MYKVKSWIQSKWNRHKSKGLIDVSLKHEMKHKQSMVGIGVSSPPHFEILLIPQWNPSYIATFKLVKKAAPTLPTLLKSTLLNWDSNQGRKETQV